MWNRRMDGIAGKDRAGAQAFVAKEMWLQFPEMHLKFLESALEWGVCHFEGDYSPYEPQEQGYPGCPADMTLTSVTLFGFEVMDLLTKEQVATIEDQLMEERFELDEEGL